MATRGRGLYEELLTPEVAAELAELTDRLVPRQGELRPAEAADRIALHLSKLIERTIDDFKDHERVAKGVEFAQTLVDAIRASLDDEALGHERPVSPGTVLRAIESRRPDGTPETIEAPLIPLLDTTLLTNAPGEPNVGSQLRTEIASAERIDVVMAFVRHTGIARMLDALETHCHHGRALRVLTTTYTGSTEARALDALARIGAEIRVSYDTSTTRLHAKAWVFHRSSRFSTAYVGSSNLTHSAQVSGLEWNVRVSGARNPDVIDKMSAVFDSYWGSDDFVPYERDQFIENTSPDRREPTLTLSPLEVTPWPFQARLLEQIEMARQQGHNANLLVSATGTGKTVMAALDYAGLRARLPRARLLFVAHRAEILRQSQATFCHVLREPSFGERWVGGHRPTKFDHVFASIQSLRSADLRHFDPEHFDVVIVDEFHHAAARSYDSLLEHLKPAQLLGLTATPERSDGLPILKWFEGRIAAELRLWDAIEQRRLVPFAYYGIHDRTDLRKIPWRRGTGYDVEELSNLLTADDAWANLVLEQLRRRVGDISKMRALGFCVGVEHARFMAKVFRRAGVEARAVWSETPADERKGTLAALATGTINIVFAVDLFNEGIDVPTVDTLLMLRPTDSPTLFLQQLGRGLRRSRDKSLCTVLDFVGHHHRDFRLDRRFRALLRGSRREVERQVEEGFPFLPAGCHMELDRVARDVVLASIRSSVPSRWNAKVEELRRLAGADGACSLAEYLARTGMTLEDVYSNNRGWSELCEDAGLATHPAGPKERTLRRACGRLLHVDDPDRIAAYSKFLSSEAPPSLAKLSSPEQRMLRMLVASIVDKAVTKATPLDEGCTLLWGHPQVREDARQVLAALREQVEHLTIALDDPEIPLRVHGRYTRLEILAAFGIGEGAKVSPWQTGVYWAESARSDLLAFTLDKTQGHFSPTTRYRDYAISRELIHWQSQSATRADGKTGTRYQRHVERGSRIMLFARMRTDERAFHFLGPATYVEHRGERPMSITWKLRHPLPGDLFATFAAAVA